MTMADVFERMQRAGHEQVLFTSDPESGYRGIIAIHDTTLGPGLGGTRIRPYGSDDEALADVLRLSQAMTWKASVAGLDCGGGKSVILADPRTIDRETVFRAHGRAIQSLGGRYHAAEDVGTSPADMASIRMETSYVTGLADLSGDPSPLTALGTFHGMRACALHRWGSPDLAGRHVALQGVGSVGLHLCRLLHEAGARLTVADVDPERTDRAEREFGAAVASTWRIHAIRADIFSPCALGGSIADGTIGELGSEIVAGAANNQLDEDRHGDELHRRGILYAPDFVINAGGLISVYGELTGKEASWTRGKAEAIHDTLLGIFRTAEEQGVPPATAALRVARERIDAARRNGSHRGSVSPSSGRDIASPHPSSGAAGGADPKP